ncbi:MAG: AbrB family transcriptional regulator [Clostridia bacterium]
MEIVLTTLVGVAGAKIARFLKIPAGIMTGSMIFIIIYNFIWGSAYFPVEVRPIVQIISGCFIGLNIDKQAFLGLKKLLVPAIVYFLSLLFFFMLAGYIISVLTTIDLVTALLACVPGGVVDMSLLSYDFEANTAQVTTLQMMRLVFGLGVFPTITHHYVKRFGKNHEAVDETEQNEKEQKAISKKNIVITGIAAAIGGTIGYYSGFPAGTLAFSMIATAIYNVKTNNAYMPKDIRKVAQIFAGAMVGATVTRADILNLKYLIIPFAIVLIQYLIINYGIGPMIARIFKIDLMTMLLSCTPAGVSDMALIAGDMGGDGSKVAVFQIVRLGTALTLFPAVIKLLIHIIP